MNIVISVEDEVAERAREMAGEMGETLEQASKTKSGNWPTKRANSGLSGGRFHAVKVLLWVLLDQRHSKRDKPQDYSILVKCVDDKNRWNILFMVGLVTKYPVKVI